MPLLEVLRLSGIDSLTDETGIRIGTSCPELRKLDVSGSAALSDKTLHAIQTGCGHLEQLALSGTTISAPAVLCALAQFSFLQRFVLPLSLHTDTVYYQAYTHARLVYS